MTNGIPVEVTHQVEAAIRGAFDHDELWRATRSMGDLHDEVTHTSFAVEVAELVDWVGKRNKTLELLENLLTAVPGNVGLQTARDAYAAAEKDARENRPSPSMEVAALAGSGKSPDTPAAARADTKSKGLSAPPWAWMVLGALILIVLAFVFLGGEDEPTVPMEYGDSEALDLLYDDCELGEMLACDNLFDLSEAGSEYEAFADTCGDRVEFVDDTCVAELGEQSE